MKNHIKKGSCLLIFITVYLIFGSAIHNCFGQCVSDTVYACIDYDDYLYIQGNSMWWVNLGGSPPGIHPGCSSTPVTVNGNTWATWNTPFILPFNTTCMSMTYSVMQCYNICNLIQAPSCSNNWETIYEFNDKSPGGPHWYEIVFTFCPTCTTVLTINTSSTVANCSSCNGTATVSSVTGGTAPYTYIWSTTPTQTTATASNLCAGTYTVTVTDSSGCNTSSASVIVTSISLTPVTLSPTTSAICSGDSVTLTASGVTTYSWSPSTGLSSTTGATVIATPTITTTYIVTGTDSSGCTSTDSTIIIVNPNPTVNISASADTICTGISTTLTANGATTYLWSGGLGTANPVTITPLSTTTYSVTGTDINGCTGTANITVTVNTTTVSITASANPICVGASTVLTAGGATTYLWNGGSNTNPLIVTPTSTTIYTVTGTALGCTGTASITVTVNPNPIPTISTVNSTCGYSNGSATANPVGLIYLWSNGQTTQTAINLLAGAYSVTVTDANGCTGTANCVVSDTPGPSITATFTDENCGHSNGTASPLPVAGTPPFTYLWNNSQTTQNIVNLPAGTYSVTVTDVNGCTASTSVTLIDLPGPSISIISTINTECGLPNGSANTSVTGNNPPYNYNWSNLQTGANLVNVLNGTYTVTLTDAIGCTATTTVTIGGSPGPTATATSTNDICYFVNGTATVNAVSGTPPYNYLWNPTNQTSQTATGLTAGGYFVTVTDAMGCIATTFINVYSTPGPTADFNYHPTILTILNDIAYFINNSSSNVVSWQWNFGDGTLGNGSDPNHTYPNPGNYVVTLIVTDNKGCQDTAIDTIKVKDIFAFYIPNAFSPNNDGFNDIFTPKGNYIDPDNYNEYIFDRWGNLIFHTTKWIIISGDEGEAESWNGTKNNRGTYSDVIMGVYVYRIKCKEIAGVKHEYIGRITLVP